MVNQVNQGILRVGIAILALADGTIHLLLDFVLFRGRFFGSPFPAGPRPGALPGRVAPPPGPRINPFILPLNELFLLNFIGAVILVLLFWFSRRLLGTRRWIIDLALIAYEAATFIGWWMFGRPNPMGLGYLSKGIEIVLVIALLVDLWSIFRPSRLANRVPASGTAR